MPALVVTAPKEDDPLIEREASDPNLTPSERTEKLEELEKRFKEYIAEQRERLKLEKALLADVLSVQGFSAAARATSNSDKASVFATVKQLMPTTEI